MSKRPQERREKIQDRVKVKGEYDGNKNSRNILNAR